MKIPTGLETANHRVEEPAAQETITFAAPSDTEKSSVSAVLDRIADRARGQPGIGAVIMRLLQEMRGESR